jgi:hypothetical protein
MLISCVVVRRGFRSITRRCLLRLQERVCLLRLLLLFLRLPGPELHPHCPVRR